MTAEANESSQRGLIILLVFTFFMVIGFTMIMPLVIVHYVNNLGFAATAVALALAIRQLCQQGLAVVGGALADRFDIRLLICSGVLLRVFGFACLACAANLPLLIAAMVLIAVGGMLFEMPYQTAIATLTTEENRPRYYSLNNVITGIATTTGPLIGVALLRFNFQAVCLGAALCFVITFVTARWALPPIKRPASQQSLGDSLKIVLRDRPFLFLTFLMVIYWMAAAQINVSFPLIAEQLAGSADGVGVLFALHAGMTALLQYPLVRLFERRFDPRQSVVIGVLLITLGLALVAFASSFMWFLAVVALFTCGVLLARPNQQTLTVGLSDQRALGIYLGVNALGLAIGGGIGTLLGGWLFDLAQATGWTMAPWLSFSFIGLCCAIGFMLFARIGQANPASEEAKVAVS